MPIINYERRAEMAEQKVFNNPRIPDQTKKILRRFLTAYDVSAARRQIFLDKIPPLLEHFTDIEKALTDRDAINEFFAGLRQRYSPASYATYINVVRRFLSWLNRGERPESRELKSKRCHHSCPPARNCSGLKGLFIKVWGHEAMKPTCPQWN